MRRRKNEPAKELNITVKRRNIFPSVAFTFYAESEFKNIPLKQYVDHLIVSCPITELCQKDFYLRLYIESILGNDRNSEYLDSTTLFHLLNTTFQKTEEIKKALKNCRKIIKVSILKERRNTTRRIQMAQSTMNKRGRRKPNQLQLREANLSRNKAMSYARVKTSREVDATNTLEAKREFIRLRDAGLSHEEATALVLKYVPEAESIDYAELFDPEAFAFQ